MSSSQSTTRRRRRQPLWDGAIRKQARLKPGGGARIWTNTPHDIILQLFKFLPPTSLSRFRCVSRSWSSGIASTAPSTTSSYFISFYDYDLRIFDGRSWKNFPLAVRDMEFGVSFVSSSAGLVLTTGTNSEVWFSVHNPLVAGCGAHLEPLNLIKTLREEDKWNAPVAFSGIEVLPSTLTSDGKISFIVVCVTSGKQVLVHVFDSRRWSWVARSAPVMPGVLGEGQSEALVRGLGIQSTLLLQDQVLYFLTVSRENSRSLKSINIWDPEHSCKTLATWKDLPLELDQPTYDGARYSNNPSLITCQGKLMLVNVMSCAPSGAIGFVYLDEESRRWREVTSFPTNLFPDNARKKNIRGAPLLSAVGSRESSQVALSFPFASWGCVYDLANSTWCSVNHEEAFRPFHPSFFKF